MVASDYSAYEIIKIVHELHLRGYEQLRLLPGMSPSGMSWRWMVYPKIAMKDDNRVERSDNLLLDFPHGSTAEGLPANGWKPKRVDKFLKENELIIRLAKAKDSSYVEWFTQIVEHAENDDYPIAYADYSIGDSWMFMKGEALSFPPFTPASVDELSDKQAVEEALKLNLISL